MANTCMGGPFQPRLALTGLNVASSALPGEGQCVIGDCSPSIL